MSEIITVTLNKKGHLVDGTGPLMSKFVFILCLLPSEMQTFFLLLMS